MKPEPKVRKDGKCVVCKQPLDIKPRASLDPRLYVDPFCSASCARSYFGTETKVNVHAWETDADERLPAYDSCPECGERKKRESQLCHACRRKRARELRRPLITRECDMCREQFQTRFKTQRYCSRTCANRHWHLHRRASS